MREDPDRWTGGIAINYAQSESLELIAELHTIVDPTFPQDGPVLNFGLRKQLSERYTLLASAGTGVGNSEDRTVLIAYLGLQLHFR
ncbi:MAG TPA: hypothetical protein VFB20_17720 [Burkholderiales bacterium]|nr:hypothetical protein [Burkholderiales bacterium]